MNTLAATYNPTFMNEMLAAAEALRPRVRAAFMEPGKEHSAVLSDQEQTVLLRMLGESHSITSANRGKTIERAESLFNNIAENSTTSDYGKLAMSGERRELTPAAEASMLQACKSFLTNLLQEKGISGDQKISDAILAATGITDLYAVAWHNVAEPRQSEIVQALVDKVCSIEQELISKPDQVNVTTLSDAERLQQAGFATLVLFVIGRELGKPGFASFLVEMRDPQLGEDISSFFKKYPNQLALIRKNKLMSADDFSRLTSPGARSNN